MTKGLADSVYSWSDTLSIFGKRAVLSGSWPSKRNVMRMRRTKRCNLR
jgi:hypothetical protein